MIARSCATFHDTSSPRAVANKLSKSDYHFHSTPSYRRLPSSLLAAASLSAMITTTKPATLDSATGPKFQLLQISSDLYTLACQRRRGSKKLWGNRKLRFSDKLQLQISEKDFQFKFSHCGCRKSETQATSVSLKELKFKMHSDSN